MTSHFTRRDALDSAITGHGSSPVADLTGTTPTRTVSGYDAELLAAFNAARAVPQQTTGLAGQKEARPPRRQAAGTSQQRTEWSIA